ncbi:MAG: menaquinone reductase multiheme cytochrome c subunit QrcA [Syntrophobacteraceae bacterium]
MKEERKDVSGRAGGIGPVFFIVGFLVALGFGWFVFPDLLYSEKTQPVNFPHAKHQDGSCEDCHSFRKDGSYTGAPKMASCKECHEDPVGDSKDEKALVEEYIQKDKEIPWQTYAWQPDNVYFSHAPHLARDVECTRCHRDVTKEDKLPVVKVNRLTGYRPGTMSMVECEKCHVQNGASNACAACHK